jgi:hypothetical protein
MSKEITRQAEHQRRYPLIPVPAHIKVAVKAWAKANGLLMYKIGDLIEKMPEMEKFIKEAKNA